MANQSQYMLQILQLLTSVSRRIQSCARNHTKWPYSPVGSTPYGCGNFDVKKPIAEVYDGFFRSAVRCPKQKLNYLPARAESMSAIQHFCT